MKQTVNEVKNICVAIRARPCREVHQVPPVRLLF
jgi:hypothetical protein